MPDRFLEVLHEVKSKSGMPWSVIAACMDVSPITIRRWRARLHRPYRRQRRALRALARDLDVDTSGVE